jgi:hypothetical protein
MEVDANFIHGLDLHCSGADGSENGVMKTCFVCWLHGGWQKGE